MIHHAVLCHAHSQRRRIALAQGDCAVDITVVNLGLVLAGPVDQPGTPLEHQLEHLQLGLVVHHLKGDGLEVHQRPAEEDPLLGVVAADIQALVCASQASGRHHRAGDVESRHVDVETLVLFTQNVLLGDLRVLVDEPTGGQAHAAHVGVGGVGRARRVGGEPGEGRSLVAFLGLGQEQSAVSTAPLRGFTDATDVGLLAVDDPAFAGVLGSSQLDIGQIRSSAGLCRTDAHEPLTGSYLGEYLLLGLFRAVVHQQHGPTDAQQGVDREGHA